MASLLPASPAAVPHGFTATQRSTKLSTAPQIRTQTCSPGDGFALNFLVWCFGRGGDAPVWWRTGCDQGGLYTPSKGATARPKRAARRGQPCGGSRLLLREVRGEGDSVRAVPPRSLIPARGCGAEVKKQSLAEWDPRVSAGVFTSARGEWDKWAAWV
jgi:hypothetical protein